MEKVGLATLGILILAGSNYLPASTTCALLGWDRTSWVHVIGVLRQCNLRSVPLRFRRQ